ncbi:MAG: hypothetical protein RR280_10515 [Bacteroidaceae bacterium]
MRKKIYFMLAVLYRYYSKGSATKGIENMSIVGVMEVILILTTINIILLFDLKEYVAPYVYGFIPPNCDKIEQAIKVSCVMIPPLILGCYFFPKRKVKAIKVKDKEYRIGITLFFLTFALTLFAFAYLLLNQDKHL